MTPLADRLRDRIRRDGPLGLDQYMAAALTDSRHGYYMTRDPFGQEGDFVTAPGVSQMFGELLGLWAADLWQRAGAPAPLALVELGPGRGEMMADLLRVAASVAGFAEALRPVLVETSPALRTVQQRRLAGREAQWCGSVAEVPEMPAVWFANEFFDALPVRQFERAGGRWRERRVALGGEAGFAFTPGAPGELPDPALARALAEAPEGAVAEYAPAAEAVAAGIGSHLARWGGAALVIDYGYEEGDLAAAGGGDTLQAVRAHTCADPLEAPGTADLTAHVNFTALARAAETGGAQAGRITMQGRFLGSLGLGARAAALARGRPPALQEEIAAAHQRLAGVEGMGALFRVLALKAPDWPEPEGFA